MIPSHVEVHLCTVACDMRKQARGLAAMVRNELGHDLQSGHAFVFYNRGRDLLRLLFWGQTEICVLSKRLDQGRFPISIGDGQDAPSVSIDMDVFAKFLVGKS